MGRWVALILLIVISSFCCLHPTHFDPSRTSTNAATTVAATMRLAHAAGISTFVTGELYIIINHHQKKIH